MKFKFFKYHGAGNDFIMIDNRDRFFKYQDVESIQQLCHRRFGIGADGLILIQNHYDYDFEMVYFNANGKVGSMCGNGGRCAIAFAQYLKIIKENKTQFKASDGGHIGFIDGDMIKLQMKNVENIEVGSDFYFLDTGSPHYVKFVENLEHLNVYEEGRAIRYNDRFAAEGTNVNFVEIKNNTLLVRTYERGVEDETYACGTGATAVALVAAMSKGISQQPVQVKTKGGDLAVSFEKTGEQRFENIYLIGPVVQVFEGTYKVQ